MGNAITAVVINAAVQPDRVAVDEILVRPTDRMQP